MAMENGEEVVLYEEDDKGIATITINRPKAMNSLTQEVFGKIYDICRKLKNKSATAKVVILTGAGAKAFSAGNDVRGGTFTAAGGGNPRLQLDTIEALDSIPQPLLVAVNGFCFTGALELLMPGDIILAGQKQAVFCDTHSQLGMVPTWGLSVRLPRRVGLPNAKLISFTGRRFSADQAKEMGLVDMVCPDADLLSTAKALAGEMADKSTESITKQKKMMDYGFMSNARDALAWTDDVLGFHPGAAKDMGTRMKTLFGAGKSKL